MKRLAVCGALLLAALLSMSSVRHSVSAQAGIGMRMIDEIGGECWEADVFGNVMYGACGRRLIVVDITDPTKPVMIGRSEVYPETAYAVEVSADGKVAFVQFADERMRVFNVAKPEAIVEIYSFESPMTAMVDTRLLNVDQREAVFEIALEQSSESELAEIEPKTQLEILAFDFEVMGNRMYLTTAEQFMVMDISDPYSPVILGDWKASGSMPLVDIAVEGKKVFLVQLLMNIIELNITIEKNPLFVRVIETEYVRAITAKDGLLITTSTYSSSNNSEILDTTSGKVIATVPNGWHGLIYKGHAIVAGRAGVQVTRLTDGQSARLEGEFLDDLVDIRIDESGVGYVASLATGLHLMDFTDLLQPKLVGSHLQSGDVFRITWPYAAGQRGLYLFNEEGGLSHYADADSVNDILLRDGVVYTCSASIFPGTWGLKVFDSATLEAKAQRPLARGCRTLASSSSTDQLFVGSGDALRLYDLSNPSAPTLKKEYTDIHPMSLELNQTGTVLYVGDWDQGLKVYSVEGSDLVLKDSIELGSGVTADLTLVAEDTLYLLLYRQGKLMIIDVSDPGNLSEVDTVTVHEGSYGMRIVQDLVWLTGSNAIQALEFSKELQPHVIGSILTRENGQIDNTPLGWLATHYGFGFGVYVLRGEAPTPMNPPPIPLPTPTPTKEEGGILYLPYCIVP